MRPDRFHLASLDPPDGCAVLVIGSGISGLSTALELAERGVRDILVVDHGPFVGFEHRTRTTNPIPLPTPPAAWHSTSEHYAVLPGVISPVGGRSRCWHGVVLPISRRMLTERWPRPVVDELFGDGPGSYAAALRDLERWRGEPLDAAQCGSDEKLWVTLGELWPDTPLAVVPQVGRSVDSPLGRQFWVYSPLLAWQGTGLHRYRGTELPTIAPGLQALRLLTDGDRVTGALFGVPGGGTRTIGTDVVVLAAGVLENTRLYAQALASTGQVIAAWRGLNDHITHGYIVSLPAALDGAWSRPDRAFLWAETEAEVNANLFVDVHAAGLPEPILDLWWMAQQEEPFDGAVCFEPGDEVWAARVDAGLSSLDHAAIARRDEVGTQLLKSLAVHTIDESEPVETAVAIERSLATRRTSRYVNPLGIADHEAGTVRLGAHLGFGGRSPWAANLFLVGPGTFPAAGAANPTLTIIALAAQTAATIVDGERQER